MEPVDESVLAGAHLAFLGEVNGDAPAKISTGTSATTRRTIWSPCSATNSRLTV